MKKILSVGEDFWLLSSRAAVLHSTGASVFSCGASTLEMYFGIENVDLVVLCHTLSDEVRHRVTAELHRRWPQTRVIQLFTGYCYVSEVAEVDACVAAAEPGKLVQQVIELLENPHRVQGRKVPQRILGLSTRSGLKRAV